MENLIRLHPTFIPLASFWDHGWKSIFKGVDYIIWAQNSLATRLPITLYIKFKTNSKHKVRPTRHLGQSPSKKQHIYFLVCWKVIQIPGFLLRIFSIIRFSRVHICKISRTRTFHVACFKRACQEVQ